MFFKDITCEYQTWKPPVTTKSPEPFHYAAKQNLLDYSRAIAEVPHIFLVVALDGECLLQSTVGKAPSTLVGFSD